MRPSLFPTVPATDHASNLAALRRMKVGATLLLLVALGIYVSTYRVSGGAHGWVGYARAAAEAAMVGGLADWFAVTALFRHPLGLPIPHTALIPRRKEALGRSLQAFVGENFLTEQTIRSQLAAAGLPQRLGGLLTRDDHADRLAAEITRFAASAVRVLDESDLRQMAAQAVRKRMTALPIGPYLGELLGPLVRDGIHHQLVDLGVVEIHRWLRTSRESIIDMIEEQAPAWTPRFVDRSVARKLHSEALRIAADVEQSPDHPLRHELDVFLLALADDLRSDANTIARTDTLFAALLDRPEASAAFGQLISGARQVLVDQLEAPSDELRAKVRAAIQAAGVRLTNDAHLHAKIDQVAGRVVAYVVGNFREEITRVITDTVNRWDGRETSRKVEVQIGKDLQYIRVNGTVVGALAGVVIHAVSALF